MAKMQQLLRMGRWRIEVVGDGRTMRILQRDISSMMGNKMANWLDLVNHRQQTLLVVNKQWSVILMTLVQFLGVLEEVQPVMLAEVEVQALAHLKVSSSCLQILVHSNVVTNGDDSTRGDTFKTNGCRKLSFLAECHRLITHAHFIWHSRFRNVSFYSQKHEHLRLSSSFLLRINILPFYRNSLPVLIAIINLLAVDCSPFASSSTLLAIDKNEATSFST